MKLGTYTAHKLFRPAVGAALAVIFGLALWTMPLGESLANASYDYSALFGARAITNKVVLVLMDNAAHSELGQKYGQPWDRRLHTALLDKRDQSFGQKNFSENG